MPFRERERGGGAGIGIEKRRARGDRSRDERVLCALGEPCKQRQGIYRKK